MFAMLDGRPPSDEGKLEGGLGRVDEDPDPEAVAVVDDDAAKFDELVLPLNFLGSMIDPTPPKLPLPLFMLFLFISNVNFSSITLPRFAVPTPAIPPPPANTPNSASSSECPC